MVTVVQGDAWPLLLSPCNTMVTARAHPPRHKRRIEPATSTASPLATSTYWCPSCSLSSKVRAPPRVHTYQQMILVR